MNDDFWGVLDITLASDDSGEKENACDAVYVI